MTDWHALLTELNVPCYTAGKNVAKDCVNIQCPCPGCDDKSNHFGFNTITGHTRCWKCKGAPAAQAISWAAHIPIGKARELIQKYTYGEGHVYTPRVEYASSLKLPGKDLLEIHKNYLRKRGLDPDFLVRYYHIKGTGVGEKWEGIPFGLRIIIPIRDETGETVSFQGRDITGLSPIRYKGCPKEKALKNYKHLLYGADLAWNYPSVVVVEGVVDAWKLGPGAVCTFGTGMTKEQLLMLSHWKSVTFFFDPEKNAQGHAKEYATELAMYGTDSYFAWEDFGTLPNGDKRDVGDLAPHELARVKSELGL